MAATAFSSSAFLRRHRAIARLVFDRGRAPAAPFSPRSLPSPAARARSLSFGAAPALLLPTAPTLQAAVGDVFLGSRGVLRPADAL